MNRTAHRESALERARAHSPFLRAAGQRQHDVAEIFLAAGAGAAIAEVFEARDEDVAVMLRRQRERLALAVALGDLSGELPLEAVTRTLSDFADRAIDRALAAAIEERNPGAPLEGLAVLALGKLGSRELNYSSDVDLILLYDPERLPRASHRDASEEAVRLGRRFVSLLQERTPHGYVARVDLRLRPAPEVTPIVLPVEAAIGHYESAAMGWERAAFIRARAAGGDIVLGQRFLDAIQPFVWRRAIDFGVVEEIRSLGNQVRDHFSEGQRFGPGYDLKRGRGGIREVEFFVQAQQMIHGGRDPALRQPATLDAIGALSLAGHFDNDTAASLADAYRALRTAEHRVQMIDDRQTHCVPEGEALEAVAALDGADSGKVWLETLRPHVEATGERFDAIAGEGGGRLPGDEERLAARLADMGFEDPSTAVRLVSQWRSGRARSLRSAAARDAFEAMLPTMLGAIAEAPDAGHALNRFADIVDHVPSGINFYRLLDARPDLARQLARILSTAPALADQLARRPGLLDGLVDRSAFDAPAKAKTLARRLREEMAPLAYDVALDRARRSINEKRFGIGVRLVDAKVDPLEAAKDYATVAEGAIRALARRTVREFEIVHGRFKDHDGLVILGLGRLGGEALTHASDLDLVYLYDAPESGQSSGGKPLGPFDYFNRLASRVTAALSVPTASGPLYEVDTRLRPQGKDGPLAVPIDAFLAYQKGEAWTWEHMAMARARPLFGPKKRRKRLLDDLQAILAAPHDRVAALEAARQMRAEIAQHKPPTGDLDIKLGPGGLVDLEFAVHTRQLMLGQHFDPDLDKAVQLLVAAGEAPASLVEDHRLLTRMLVVMRLVAPDVRRPARAARALMAELTGHADWDALLEAHDAARQRVSDYWKSTGETT
ncbi:bifunctional [glutamate--ammonia ligase]-adenylyl-L-tyrosine phosphorylase/[glutamate--ammonia-ligase] adenylyltransferase [Sphingomicrobium nitratireducens]|uniref:bifunctional [glutamate--ammonia ligase]-adenylyl-L-tyrosine phosphorylase/[glutamate--ammonia-ligase] adenylyltransferase n=1 Tax=Sphingomicrobium nitratireducens TaxID=2964666 RepID=UPI00223F9D59|nr:bifunctional [glutamate--ammonia ligase]-adenylyl-L-tyrosine phosphorylase/[glutamate--ammonia-ligase] adenylyltransferase [Sphingomicrobium nitratireducens]